MKSRLLSLSKQERPFAYLQQKPAGWHDIADICKGCDMTRNEVGKMLKNKPVEAKVILVRECMRGSNLVFEDMGSVRSTAYRVKT